MESQLPSPINGGYDYGNRLAITLSCVESELRRSYGKGRSSWSGIKLVVLQKSKALDIKISASY